MLSPGTHSGQPIGGRWPVWAWPADRGLCRWSAGPPSDSISRPGEPLGRGVFRGRSRGSCPARMVRDLSGRAAVPPVEPERAWSGRGSCAIAHTGGHRGTFGGRHATPGRLGDLASRQVRSGPGSRPWHQPHGARATRAFRGVPHPGRSRIFFARKGPVSRASRFFWPTPRPHGTAGHAQASGTPRTTHTCPVVRARAVTAWSMFAAARSPWLWPASC
jgi:hypothetical protein